jgi:hypothetical protein
MKNLFTKKSFYVAASCALLLGSCYIINSVEMPSEVEANGEFTVTTTIIGNEEARDITSYGCFGILVPTDWEVTDVVYNYIAEGAEPVVINMKANEVYTNIMNYRYSYVKDGDTTTTWKWVGFSSGLDGDDKTTTTIGSNNNNKVVCTAKVKVGATPGNYRLEILGGDEEDQFTKYADNMAYDSNNDNRLFEVGTFAVDPAFEPGDGTKSIHNPNIEANTTITVTEAAGLKAVSADNNIKVLGGVHGVTVVANDAALDHAIVTVFNAKGAKVGASMLVDGQATVAAQKGVCFVEVLKGANKSVKKVFVK